MFLGKLVQTCNIKDTYLYWYDPILVPYDTVQLSHNFYWLIFILFQHSFILRELVIPLYVLQKLILYINCSTFIFRYYSPCLFYFSLVSVPTCSSVACQKLPISSAINWAEWLTTDVIFTNKGTILMKDQMIKIQLNFIM